MKSLILSSILLVALPWYLVAETHPAVQAALEYQLPANTCGEQVIVLINESTGPAQESGATSFFEGSSTASVSDIDGYERKRLERKEKRRLLCVTDYKETLLAAFEALKNSAQHGISREQADIILKNMALIQSVYMTPNGRIEETSNTLPGG